MDIVCEHCKSRFRVSDDKLPSGKIASFPCPKCKEKITVGAEKKQANLPEPEASVPDDIPTGDYDASDKPFDFAEEEGKTALICVPDPNAKKPLLSALEGLDYYVTDGSDTADALKKMRYHLFDLVLVDEAFDSDPSDGNRVLAYLERLAMATRRNIYVVLLSRTHRTLDNMTAFNKSVNMVLNVKDIGQIGNVLGRGMTDNDFFYNVFRETLRKMGRA